MNDINRIKELTEELNKHSNSYYVLDNPTISDKTYDTLYSELEKLEKENNHIEPDSPTQRIGDIVLKGFKKVQHATKLLSLDKAQTYDRIQKFCKDAESFCKINNLPKPQYVVSEKFDGLSLKTDWTDGKLERCSTRGTGEIGEDISETAKSSIVNLPSQIKLTNKISINGEAIMTQHAFEEYNRQSTKPLKNLRNGASGTLRNLNLAECRKRKLHVFFYNINNTDLKFESYSQQLDFIKEQGLPTAKYKLCESYEGIKEEIGNIGSIRNNLQYDIDGVVIAVNDVKTRELMGYTIKFPKYAIAYKFEAEEATTTLLGVEWNTGRTGKITPTALLLPCDLMGSTVGRATLNNIDDIQRKGVKINSEVYLRKSNDVIPEILGVVEDSLNNENIIDIKIPDVCPSCGSPLIRDGVHYFCTNSINCKPQISKAIVHYCQREAMNIIGFSKEGASLFIEHGIVNTMLDLYSLESKKEQIINLPKFGAKKYDNLITSIENSKLCDLSAFLYGLGIEGIGKKSSKDITKTFKNIDNFRNCNRYQLINIDDIGNTSADSIMNWLSNDNNEILLNELLKHINFKEEVKVESKSSISLEGKIFVITGKVELYKNRAELQGVIEGLGGKVSGSVSKTTSYLITDDTESGTGKNKKAKELNVDIINEMQFQEMIK